MNRKRARLSFAFAALVGLAAAACNTTKPPATTTGSLAITVAGLPAGVAAAVRVSGPTQGLPLVTASHVLGDLTPGTYEVSSASVDVKDDVYYASQSVATVLVKAGEVAALTVTYERQNAERGGALISVTGLPPGLPASVTITGPAGYQRSMDVTGSGELDGLEAGDYSLLAAPAESVYRYAPVQASQTFTVQAGMKAKVAVAYAPVTGVIEFNLDGLPEGAPANVVVTGPAGNAIVVDRSATLTDLPPGSYSYQAAPVSTAADVTAGEVGYRFEVFSRSLFDGNLDAGETEVIELGYAATTGSVVLVVKGLPGGADADVTATLPGGRQVAFRGSGALNNLAPGARVDVAAASTQADYTFAPSPPEQSASPGAGKTSVVEILYQATEGDLELSSKGLPNGTQATVTVDGPDGFSAEDFMPLTLRVPPGTYGLQVAATIQSDQETTYRLIKGPAFAEVAPGQPTSVTFSYALAGSLHVEISGAGDSGANVVVTGPQGYSSGRIRASVTLSPLPIGLYQVDAYAIEPILYPDPPTQTVRIRSEASSEVTVRYKPPVVHQGENARRAR